MADRKVLQFIFEVLRQGTGDKDAAAGLKEVNEEVKRAQGALEDFYLTTEKTNDTLYALGKIGDEATTDTEIYTDALRSLRDEMGISTEALLDLIAKKMADVQASGDAAAGTEIYANAVKDLGEAQKKTGDETEELTKKNEKLQKELGEGVGLLSKELFGVNVATLGAGAAIGAVGAVVVDSIKKTMDLAESVETLGRDYDLTAEEASKLIYISEHYKVSTAEMETALKMAVKNGFVPTLANLQKLSDAYKEYDDPVARAQALTAMFGENWAALTPILAAGREELERVAESAERAGLVMSEENVAAAKELSEASEELQGILKGLQVQLGNFLIPKLKDAAEAVVLLATQNDKINAALEEHKEEILGTSESYKDYALEVIRAQMVTENLTDAEARAAIERKLQVSSLQDLAAFYGAASIEEWALANAIANGTYQTTAQKEALEQQMPVLHDAADAVKELAEQEAELDDRMASLKTAMDAYRQGMNDWKQVGTEAGNVLSEKLTPGSKEWLAAAQALDAATGSNIYNQYMYNKALEDATDAYAETGDIEAYTQAVTDAAETYKDLTPMETLRSDAEAAYDQVADLIAEMNDIPSEIKTYITVVRRDLSQLEETGAGTTGTVAEEWKQTGLDMTVPPGFEQDDYAMQLHVKSGERVRVETPDQQNAAGAGGRTGPLIGTVNIIDRFSEVAVTNWLSGL